MINFIDDVSELKGTIHGEYMKQCYLSKRDLIGYFSSAIEVPITKTLGIPWMVCYATSNCGNRLLNLSESSEKLGYVPLDSPDKYLN